MEELIIILILGTGCFFLTRHKEEIKEEKPLTHSQAIQTEPLIPNNSEKEERKALESTLDELIKEIRKLNHSIK